MLMQTCNVCLSFRFPDIEQNGIDFTRQVSANFVLSIYLKTYCFWYSEQRVALDSLGFQGETALNKNKRFLLLLYVRHFSH